MATWEVLILTNDECEDEWYDSRIRTIATGRLGPARKRDIGAELATGDILVFLDDDSYPRDDLLEVADRHFCDSEVVAIGGPGITPLEDTFWQRVSGAAFLSRLSGGNPERYLGIGAPRLVDDWPSVNFMIRRDLFLQLGGFDCNYWPGEDTLLCRKLIKNTGRQIVYVPDLVVWHHRRSGFFKHLLQIGNYAKHRGYFAKRFPENSRKLQYFIPTLFAIFVLASCFATLLPFPLQIAILSGWLLYSAALIRAWFEIAEHEDAAVATMALPYIVTTHFWYGIQFAVGLMVPKLTSRLR